MLCRHPVNWPMCVFIIPIRCPQMFQMEVRPVQIGDLPGEIGEPMWEARILKQVQKAHTHTDTETHKESFFPSECGVGVRVFFIIHIPRSRVWFIAPSYHHSHLLSPWCCPAKVKRTKGFDLRKTHACRNLQQGGIRNHRKAAVGCWQ